MTARRDRKGLRGEGCQGRMPGQDARAGLLGQDCPDMAAMTELPGQDCYDKTVRARQKGTNVQYMQTF
jgi:hypothetical protein